jgi:PHD/YefM family antitoxin component YafN of YafNO toxin-antitoxin module
MATEIDFVDLYEFLLKNDVSEPVVVRKNGEKHAVMIPYEIYEAMRKNSRKALRTGELSPKERALFSRSKAPESSKQYNDEVEDD